MDREKSKNTEKENNRTPRKIEVVRHQANCFSCWLSWKVKYEETKAREKGECLQTGSPGGKQQK